MTREEREKLRAVCESFADGEPWARGHMENAVNILPALLDALDDAEAERDALETVAEERRERAKRAEARAEKAEAERDALLNSMRAIATAVECEDDDLSMECAHMDQGELADELVAVVSSARMAIERGEHVKGAP